jgi:hypothetical protein
MIPWCLIDTAEIPGEGSELRLKRRGTEFSIMLGTIELMNSRLSGSEEALAKVSCRRIQSRQRPQVLIGGLGMGFTLALRWPNSAQMLRLPWLNWCLLWWHGPEVPWLSLWRQPCRSTGNHPRSGRRPRDKLRSFDLRCHSARR